MIEEPKRTDAGLDPANESLVEASLRRLLAERLAALEALEDEALGGRDVPAERQGDPGLGLFDQQRDLELLERSETTLHEIMDALERIRRRTYGRCETCGAAIRRERLRAIPHVQRCLRCA